MNKLTLAINAWRAYSAARSTEGSSLRGAIIAGISVIAVVGITLLRGDLTAADAGIIATGISGLNAVLAYVIPDRLGSVTLTSQESEIHGGSLLPPIELQGHADADFGADAGRVRVSSDRPDRRASAPDDAPAPPERDGWNG